MSIRPGEYGEGTQTGHREGDWARREMRLRIRASRDREGIRECPPGTEETIFSSSLYDASLIGLIRNAPIPLIPVAKHSDPNDFPGLSG